ncbi:ATP-binding protein [Thalassotalea sp. G2M2-11]|uniref:ATP-binding protein n=1 Tax=Thalassotalea sp. G2M2-11 TaxID=2787627 RepID=UPI0019D12E4E|nr:ATP-binding protein [Thalassotalea sp. G2M2-11]
MTFIKKYLSSIAVKLFLSFWLITILSISITRFVSIQLEQESIIVPVEPSDLRQLQRISKRIDHKQPSSVESLLKHIPMPNNVNLLLKENDSSTVYANAKRHLRGIQHFLEKNNLSNVSTIQFPFVRLTGPKTINIQGKDYLLYITHRTRPPAIGSIIMQLPMWIRYLIPFVISFLFCWILARTLTSPLIAIKKASKAIGNGHYDTRVGKAVKRSDEIGEMATSFNQMAEKLENNINAHQRLLADVSHELRSPMTRLQMTLGLIQQANHNNPTVDKHLLRCEQEVTQLDSMISNILSLSRMENNFQAIEINEINLSQLIEKVIEDNQLIAEEKAITIHLNNAGTLQLDGNASLLGSAINNIIINAIKYCQQNGTITITTSVLNDSIRIAIADDGIGVDESLLAKLFTPFYRVSDARDRDTGGTGLGLAIAKQAVDLHHGSIQAANNHSGGLTITLELPIKQLNH